MMNLKATGVALASLLCWNVHAADYYLAGDAADWSLKTSYTLADGSTPATLPGAEDTVLLPQGKACSFTAGSASFEVFAGVSWVKPHDKGGDTIEITVADGEATINCAIAVKLDAASSAKCVVTKKGAGTLKLASDKMYAERGSAWDYLSAFVIDAGDLVCYPTPSRVPTMMGPVLVKAGARLVLPQAFSADYHNNGLTVAGSIHGAGTVENLEAAECNLNLGRRLNVIPEIEDVPFSGRILGNVYLNPAYARLTGVESTFANWMRATYDDSVGSSITDNYGVWIRKFGKIGEPSSIGSGDTVGTGSYGGRLVYTGEGGEECDKKFSFDVVYGIGVPPSIMDAGAKGGVRFTGSSWTGKSTYSGGNQYMGCLLLTGSNTAPCVVDSPIRYWINNKQERHSSLHVIKRGTGTWELSGKADDSTTESAFTVEEGTLRYGSVGEIGERSALGTALMLKEAKTGKWDDLEDIPFAMLLGGPATLGTLEYVGAAPFENKTRLIGLAGKGGVLASRAADISYNGVTSAEAGEHTLVLAGDRVGGLDTVCNVTNGAGVVSVVKTGTGSWMLDGEQSFSGDLIVSNGTLAVRAPNAPYRWFRFDLLTTRDNLCPRLQELALYDATGTRQNKGLVYNRTYDNTTLYSVPNETAANLPAGHVTPVYPHNGADITKLGWGGTAPTDRDIVNLFDDQVPNSGNYSAGLFLTSLGNGTSCNGRYGEDWRTVGLVMHLADDTPAIAAYDFAVGVGTSGLLTSWRIFGSLDGQHWTVLTNATYETGAEAPSLTKGQWYSDLSKTFAKNQVRPGEGFALAGASSGEKLSLAANVLVVPGATLAAEGEVVVSRLAAVVGTSGKGTLRGVTFAESGTLDLRGEFGGSATLALAFDGCTGVENLARWSVVADGREREWKVTVEEGVVTVSKSGLVIIYR